MLACAGGGCTERYMFFPAHLGTILISHAINIYLNEDGDEDKLKVWTETRPRALLFS